MASAAHRSRVHVTARNSTDGIIYPVSTTTDSRGNTIFVTDNLHKSHDSTTTVMAVAVPTIATEAHPKVTRIVQIVKMVKYLREFIFMTQTGLYEQPGITAMPTRFPAVVDMGNYTFTMTTPTQTIGDEVFVVDMSNKDRRPTIGLPTTPPPLSKGTQAVRVVTLPHTTFTMSKATQTVGNRVFVDDKLNKYRLYDPYNYAVAPTGTCDSGQSLTGNDCRLDKCMWKYMKPMNISTVEPAMFPNEHGGHRLHYMTHVTELIYPHWGTSTSSGLYYPTSQEISVVSGTPTHRHLRATPEGNLRDSDKVHGNPQCYDLESCHQVCLNESDTFPWMDDTKLKWLLIPLLLAILATFALLLCCGLLRRRKQKDPKDLNRKESITEKIRRKSSTLAEVVVVNQVTGTATDPATGRPADPSQATAVIVGPAAGAEAGREKQDEDGKGTMGRRAEEGRGRVNFEDGGRPGENPPSAPASSQPQQQTTTEVVREDPTPSSQAPPQAQPSPPAQSEKVETVQAKPPGQTDGTSELSTGRYFVDTGSMRGRKRARPENVGSGLHLGFWGR